jgi:Leucine-rich repeat (LRR) protein
MIEKRILALRVTVKRVELISLFLRRLGGYLNESDRRGKGNVQLYKRSFNKMTETTVKINWEIEVWGNHFNKSSSNGTASDEAVNDTKKGTGRSFNRTDKSLFVSVPPKSGYLQLGRDPIRLIKCDPKKNNEESCKLFDALMLQQDLGWPEILASDKKTNITDKSKEVVDENNLNDIEQKEEVNKLEPGQLVRAMLRPGGHFYNGRITHSNEDGSMCGIKFFDGDEIDALPRSLIMPIASPKKKIVPVDNSSVETVKNLVENTTVVSDRGNSCTSVEQESAIEVAKTTAVDTIPLNTPEFSPNIVSSKESTTNITISPSDRPRTRRGRDERDSDLLATAISPRKPQAESTSRTKRHTPKRPSSARSVRPKVTNIVNYEIPAQQEEKVNPSKVLSSPQSRIVRGRSSNTHNQTPKRRRPKSANPRGRRGAHLREESFIEKNRRLVSEMSRSIVRPSAPPPPPPEPNNQRRTNNFSITDKKKKRPKWRATNRVWLDATGNGMSLWNNKVQSLNTTGASRHAGPSLMNAAMFASKGSPTIRSEGSNSKIMGGIGVKKEGKPIRSRAELIASQEFIRLSKSNRESSNSSTKEAEMSLITASDATFEDDRNIPYLLASRQRCLHETGIQSIDLSKPREKWCKGGVSAEGVRIAQKLAAESLKFSKRKDKNTVKMWSQKRAAEQRLALRALSHLERNITKVKDAQHALKQEIDTLQNEQSNQPNSTFRNKTEKKSKVTVDHEKKRFVHTMSVDDEVSSLVRRSKMVVLRAAMTGKGAATESVQSVDFDRYAVQLVMLMRRLRASLHQQGTGITFRWRWEDLEQDLSMASTEEYRMRQHQAEKSEKQRQRKLWRQQRYDDGSAGDTNKPEGDQKQSNEVSEPPKVSINIPLDFQQNSSDSAASTNVSFSSGDNISQSGVGERLNVSGPTLLRSIKRHTLLELTEHEEALLLTHFEYSPTCLNSDGTIDKSAEMRVDVQEFMDAMRPPLNFIRQRIVDAIFSRFQETEEGVRIQKWSDEVSASTESRTKSAVQTQLISGAEVWTAYCAFRTLTPVGHRRGHVALETLDLWLRPTIESTAREWLAASVRSQRNMLPSVARQPLRKEQWEALHRALGARIPNDDIFERVVRSTWVFAGQASIRALASGTKLDNNNKNSNYDSFIGDVEDVGPFGVASDAVSTFMTSVPPAVEESDKVWVKCGDLENDLSHAVGSGNSKNRIYWYCAATGERTWRQPINMRRKEEERIRLDSIRRKLTALENLNIIVSRLEADIISWTKTLRREGLGGTDDSSNDSSVEWAKTNMMCSGAVSLRKLNLSAVPTLFIGEGGSLGSGLTAELDVRESRTSNIVSHLWLDGNNFGANADSVGAFKHLLSRISPSIVELSVCGNSLCENIDDAMSSFTDNNFEKLLVLRLKGNKIQEWPSKMPQWNILADVDLSDNKLKSIPTSVLRSLKNLTHANFSKNHLVSLPSDSLKHSSKGDTKDLNNGTNVWPSTLVSLNVSGNRLKKMPSSMGAASLSLTFLDISHNSINALPSELFDLNRKCMSNIKTLLLQHNSLTGDDSLPANLPMALSRSCRRFDVSHNSLTALPNQLGSMFELRELNASFNDIVSFPSGGTTKATSGSMQQQFLPNLRVIKLESNKLSVLPNSFGKLLSSSTMQQCYLQNNKLVAIPEMQENNRKPTATGFVSGLLTLDVTNNNIVQLSRSIGRALGPSLLSLRIAHNRLESIPVASFAYFKKLQDLTCHGNPILSPDLRDVITSGTYVPPITRQVSHIVQKMFDAIKHNWDVVNTRVHTAVRKFKIQQSTGRQKRLARQKEINANSFKKLQKQQTGTTLATAQDESRNGSSLARSTDELLGSRRLFRSLNMAYQRLRECLRRFDSSGGAHGGRLDAMEFRAAVESIGMFLSPDECSFLTAFALETCGPSQENVSGPIGNTGCVGINEFIGEVLRPGSTSASKSEGVAQAVVRYCMDLSRRKVSSKQSVYNDHKDSAGSISPSKLSKFRQENQEMRLELQSLKLSQEKWRNKSVEAEQFLDGRGPKPEWMSVHAPESHAIKNNAKRKGHHFQREETVFRAKIAHEKLRQKKRLMQQKIRQESARVRRMEMKAAADPALRKSMVEPDDGSSNSRYRQASTEIPKLLQRATDNPVRKSNKKMTSVVPLQLKSLVASIRNSINMDKSLQPMSKNNRLGAFFDSIQEQEVSQGLVRTTQNDDVAGGSLISGIRQIRPAVLLPPEQCPVLLNVLGCSNDGEGGANRVSRGRFLALFQNSNETQKSKNSKNSNKMDVSQPSSNRCKYFHL